MTGKTRKDKTRLRRRVVTELMAERIVQKKTQAELAENLGTSRTSLSRIEHGRQNVTVDYIQAMAEAMDREVEFVVREAPVEYGDESTYSLKLYDEELLRFSMSRGGDINTRIIKINEPRRELLPLELEVTDEGLMNWLRRRTIPRNREAVGTVLRSLDLEITDLKGITDVCMGLSLNDSYWTPQIDFEGKFGDLNLYENRFDETLSLISYVGYGRNASLNGTTPELTTGGMLRKGWHFTKKGIYLYKSGTSELANAGNEPYSEYMAYQVANKMGLNAVPYTLANWHGMLASKCPLFTDIDTSFIPIGGIVREGGINACLDYYKELGDSFYQELVSMLVFDAVILNEDRHFGNFGLMRNNHTGEILRPAPIFDNGLSLLCYGLKQDFETPDRFEEYVHSRTNPYGHDNQFMDLAGRIIGPIQRQQLRHLIDFELEESDVTNLPSWRTSRLEELIRTRARKLMAL